MKCPFCLNELKPDETKCSQCRNDLDCYEYYKTRSAELIEQAKSNINEKSKSLEFLKYSLVLDSTKISPLKIMGLLYLSNGSYIKSLYYLQKYSTIDPKDNLSGDFINQIRSWIKNLDKIISVTF